MRKRRIFGILTMVGAVVLGGYEGVWNLFIQPGLELLQTFYDWKLEVVVLDLFKIFIFYPMLMFLALVIWKIGQMIFLDE